MNISEITKMVALQLGQEHVSPKNLLVEELGAASADIANLVAIAEERYGIFIPESRLPDIKTPEDFLAILIEYKQD